MNTYQKISAPLLIVLSFAFIPLASAADDAAGIRALISHEFDRPGATVVSDPIVIEQEFALADWVQGEKGGRSLLRKKEGQWTIMLCAGDGIKKAKSMTRAGVPMSIASALSGKLSSAESGLPSAKVKMFGRFRAEKRSETKHAEHH